MSGLPQVHRDSSEQLSLLAEPIRAHCFFACGHVASESDPQATHDAMERHYADRHGRQVRQIVQAMA